VFNSIHVFQVDVLFLLFNESAAAPERADLKIAFQGPMSMATSRFRRCGRFYFFGAACLLVTVAFLDFKPRTDPHNLSSTHPGSISDVGSSQPSTAVVIAALEKDDVSWIDFAWGDVWKYEVDNPKAKHAVPKNKGHEAMVYLTLVSDPLYNLPMGWY
jgi:hypothetical protein